MLDYGYFVLVKVEINNILLISKLNFITVIFMGYVFSKLCRKIIKA